MKMTRSIRRYIKRLKAEADVSALKRKAEGSILLDGGARMEAAKMEARSKVTRRSFALSVPALCAVGIMLPAEPKIRRRKCGLVMDDPDARFRAMDTGALRVTVEEISPTRALALLKDVAPLREHWKLRRIDNFAKDIWAGRWAVNGESLKFSSEMQLLDGSSRLRACVRAGVSFTTVMVYGFDESAAGNNDQQPKTTKG